MILLQWEIGVDEPEETLYSDRDFTAKFNYVVLYLKTKLLFYFLACRCSRSTVFPLLNMQPHCLEMGGDCVQFLRSLQFKVVFALFNYSFPSCFLLIISANFLLHCDSHANLCGCTNTELYTPRLRINS